MKNNLKKSLVLMVLLASLNVYSQKCEIKKDPISGKKTCVFQDNKKTLRYVYMFDEEVDFFTTFVYRDEQNVAIPKNSEIIFKLENDSIVKLYSVVDAMPQTKVTANQFGASISTTYTFAFKLKKDQIRTLASSKITFVRYPAIDGGYVDLDIKGFGKIYANKVTKGAICINDNL